MASSSLLILIVLVSLIHVAAFVVMVLIRVRRSEVDGTTGDRLTTRPGNVGATRPRPPAVLSRSSVPSPGRG